MAKNNPLISIVIPAAPNRRTDLIRCINSIKKSSYKNYEIIVVNNSGDIKFSQKIEKSFPFIRIFNMPHNTGIFAFNVGFANAKGDYVFTVDDDSTLLADTLSKVIKAFSKLDKNIGVISCVYKTPNFPTYHAEYKEPKYETVNSFGAGVFRKEVFEKIGYWDDSFFCWYHEEDFSMRMYNAGFKVITDKNIILMHYPKHTFRKFKIALMLRNKVWLMFKHFSFAYTLILVLRCFLSIFQPYPEGSYFTGVIYGFKGYITGLLTFYIPLAKRKPLRRDLQYLYFRKFMINR